MSSDELDIFVRFWTVYDGTVFFAEAGTLEVCLGLTGLYGKSETGGQTAFASHAKNRFSDARFVSCTCMHVACSFVIA